MTGVHPSHVIPNGVKNPRAHESTRHSHTADIDAGPSFIIEDMMPRRSPWSVRPGPHATIAIALAICLLVVACQSATPTVGPKPRPPVATVVAARTAVGGGNVAKPGPGSTQATGQTPTATVSTWERVSIPDAAISVEIPRDWQRRGQEWVWSPRDNPATRIGVKWSDIGPGWQPQSMLPANGKVLQSSAVDLGWSTATMFTVSVPDSAGVQTSEAHIVTQAGGKRAYDFFGAARTDNELNFLRPVLVQMAARTTLTTPGATAAKPAGGPSPVALAADPDAERVVLEYFGALGRNQPAAARAHLAPDAQARQSEADLANAAAAVRAISVTNLQGLSATPQRRVYRVTLLVTPNPDKPSNWNPGSNTQWVVVVRAAPGWRIAELSSSPIS